MKTQQRNYNAAFISLKNDKEDSPISEILYTRNVIGSNESKQPYEINIAIRLNKDHPDCNDVKKILLEKYTHINGMQANWEFEDYRINAKNLNSVVALLGPTYLSDSVFKQLSDNKSLLDLDTTNTPSYLCESGFYSDKKNENKQSNTPEQNSAWKCSIS